MEDAGDKGTSGTKSRKDEGASEGASEGTETVGGASAKKVAVEEIGGRSSRCNPDIEPRGNRWPTWSSEERIEAIKLLGESNRRQVNRIASTVLEESRGLGGKRVEKAEGDALEDARNERGELEESEANGRPERSRSTVRVLEKNFNSKIGASTTRKNRKKLVEWRASRALKVIGEIAFEQEFIRRHNLDARLEIEEKRLLERDARSASNGGEVEEESDETVLTERTVKPSYSRKVSEVENRWSGEFLEKRLERQSSESSKSSYVEEFGSASSGESVDDRRGPEQLLLEREKREKREGVTSAEGSGTRASVDTLGEGSTGSTVDSDSCLGDRIKALEEDSEDDCEQIMGVAEDERADIGSRWDESLDRTRTRASEAEFAFVGGACSRTDGYANLIRVLTMDSGSSRPRKEEKQKQKQKKKLGLRRLLPGFFSPKDSRKDYKKKEAREPRAQRDPRDSRERKWPDDKHFARYQQNGNYTRAADTMNLNEDMKRNVKLDNSLNGSIIEERLDEIKRELFPNQGPITSTPDHLAREEDRGVLRDRVGPPRSYTTDSSLSSIAPDERWNERNAHLGISPDMRKFEQRQKREEFVQRYGQLERKHSLQEPNGAGRCYFFQRNHGPTGRISAPPSERYLVRPRAIHPVDRPLPAIPRSRIDLSSNYVNYLEEEGEAAGLGSRYDNSLYASGKTSEYANEPGLYGDTEENAAAARRRRRPSWFSSRSRPRLKLRGSR